MKTRTWVLLLAGTALFSGLFSFFLLKPGSPSPTARIYSQGKWVQTADLSLDRQYTVALSDSRYNIITVKDGKIAVTSASCPDHCCMQRGFCNSGAPIICLPNGLEIRFTGPSQPDFSIG